MDAGKNQRRERRKADRAGNREPAVQRKLAGDEVEEPQRADSREDRNGERPSRPPEQQTSGCVVERKSRRVGRWQEWVVGGWEKTVRRKVEATGGGHRQERGGEAQVGLPVAAG